jgi:hypothetical protein
MGSGFEMMMIRASSSMLDGSSVAGRACSRCGGKTNVMLLTWRPLF